MKTKYIFLLLPFLIASCSTDPREQAIIDHEEVKNGVRTDLNMKIISLEKGKEFHAKDSIEAVSLTAFGKGMSADEARAYFAGLEKQRNESDSIIAQNDLKINASDNHIDTIVKYNKASAHEMVFLDSLLPEIKEGRYALESISALEKKSGLLATEWKCKFSITNPLLKTTQEMTRIYMFSPDEKIVDSYTVK